MNHHDSIVLVLVEADDDSATQLCDPWTDACEETVLVGDVEAIIAARLEECSPDDATDSHVLPVVYQAPVAWLGLESCSI